MKEIFLSLEGHTQGGAAGLQPPPKTPQNRNVETNFVDIISKFLRDFPFS
jgi:hypothetical protein